MRDGVGLVPDTLLDPATYFFPASYVLTFNELVDSIEPYERFVAQHASIPTTTRACSGP